MATYKITDTELNKITRFLDKIPNSSLLDLEKIHNECKKLSKEIKNNYTKIK